MDSPRQNIKIPPLPDVSSQSSSFQSEYMVFQTKTKQLRQLFYHRTPYDSSETCCPSLLSCTMLVYPPVFISAFQTSGLLFCFFFFFYVSQPHLQAHILRVALRRHLTLAGSKGESHKGHKDIRLASSPSLPMAVSTASWEKLEWFFLWLGIWEGSICIFIKCFLSMRSSVVSYLHNLHVCIAYPQEPLVF